MTNTQKKWIVSSLITFTTGFLIAIVPLMDQITVENFGWSVVSGILLAGIRAGIKATAEWIVVSK